MNCQLESLSFQDARPSVKYVSIAHGLVTERRYRYKTSFAHRLMGLLKGKCVLSLLDRERELRFQFEQGDLIYFRPQDGYQIECLSETFSVLNIHFDFTPYRPNCSGLSLIRNYDEAFDERSVPLLGKRYTFPDAQLFDDPFVLRQSKEAMELALKIQMEYTLRRRFYEMSADGLMQELLVMLFRLKTMSQGARSSQDKIESQLIEFINENYMLPLTNADFAEKFNYTADYLNRKIKLLTGMTLHQYILDTKIKKATELLLETQMTITDIAHLLSFSDHSHFTKVYKAKTGKTPCELRG